MFMRHKPSFADQVKGQITAGAAAAVGTFALGVIWSGAKLAAQKGLAALQAPVEAPKKAEKATASA